MRTDVCRQLSDHIQNLGVHLNRRAWNSHALIRHSHDATFPSEFQWTQHPGLGPGHEILGHLPGARVVEIGCGNGKQIAFLVSKGALGTGIDVSSMQIHRARKRWGSQFKHLEYKVGDAGEIQNLFQPNSVDVIYSVFGAVGLCNPRMLLPKIFRCLSDDGKLLFSVRHPEWDLATVDLDPFSGSGRWTNEGANGMFRACLQLPNGVLQPIIRFQYSVEDWIAIAESAKFDVVDMREIYFSSKIVGTTLSNEVVHSIVARSAPCTLLMTLAK